MIDATLRGSLIVPVLADDFETKTIEERCSFDTADTVLIPIHGSRGPTRQRVIPTLIVPRSRRRRSSALSMVAAATAFVAVMLVTAIVVVDATELPAPVVVR
jgi:hypothetical protein